MKPHRIRMTHNLLLNYGLYRKMEIYVRIFRKSYFIYARDSSAIIIFYHIVEHLTENCNIILLYYHLATS